MWAVHNGLIATFGPSDTAEISNLLTGCGVSNSGDRGQGAPVAHCNWSDDYTEWLARNQRVDGSWAGYSVWTDPIATAFSIAILGAAHTPIGPYRCPMAGNFWASSPNEWPRAVLTLGGRLYTRDDLVAILNGAVLSGIPHAARANLISELIAAKLNIAAGSDPAPAAGAIARTDALLAGPNARRSFSQIADDAGLLHAYNAGSLTSGCTSADSGSSPEAAATTSHTGTQMSATTTSGITRVTQPSAAKTRSRTRKGVTALGISSDGASLATGSTDKKFRVWGTGTGLQSVVLSGSLGVPTGLSFSPDGSTLATISRDSVVRLWDVVRGTDNANLTGHEHAIASVAVSPNGRTLASAGEDTRVILWDLTTRKLTKIIWGPKDFVNSVSFHPNGQTLAIAGDDARVLISDVQTGKTLFTLLGHSGPINTLSFSPDGTALASAGQDTVIHLWDPAKGQQRQALSGHSAPVRSLSFSPDGQLLASGGEDAQIFLWNVATGAISARLSSTAATNVLRFDPKGRFLAAATESGQVMLWNVKTGKLLLTITVP
jgi:WD40 repeat protein